MSRLRNINHFEYVEPGTHKHVETKSKKEGKFISWTPKQSQNLPSN